MAQGKWGKSGSTLAERLGGSLDEVHEIVEPRELEMTKETREAIPDVGMAEGLEIILPRELSAEGACKH